MERFNASIWQCQHCHQLLLCLQATGRQGKLSCMVFQLPSRTGWTPIAALAAGSMISTLNCDILIFDYIRPLLWSLISCLMLIAGR